MFDKCVWAVYCIGPGSPVAAPPLNDRLWGSPQGLEVAHESANVAPLTRRHPVSVPLSRDAIPNLVGRAWLRGFSLSVPPLAFCGLAARNGTPFLLSLFIVSFYFSLYFSFCFFIVQTLRDIAGHRGTGWDNTGFLGHCGLFLFFSLLAFSVAFVLSANIFVAAVPDAIVIQDGPTPVRDLYPPTLIFRRSGIWVGGEEFFHRLFGGF